MVVIPMRQLLAMEMVHGHTNALAFCRPVGREMVQARAMVQGDAPSPSLGRRGDGPGSGDGDGSGD